MCNNQSYHSQDYAVNHISLANGNHIWPLIRVYCSRFCKTLNWKKYGILANPRTSGNPTYNAILEYIHTVLGNLVLTYSIRGTYIAEYDSWLDILAATSFIICSLRNRLKVIVRANWHLDMKWLSWWNIRHIGN